MSRTQSLSEHVRYDPDARRDTPLALKLKGRIADSGPISVCEYMAACLFDDEFGYYRTRPAIGANGDFVTAPEVSQVFGEIVGLWSVVVWQAMGSPARANLIELGPGRGALMEDALRAASIVPEFCAATLVHMIECNRVLIEVQRERLGDAQVPVAWHDALYNIEESASEGFGTRLSVPLEPTIMVANEFFDAVPVEQFVKQSSGWFERMVEIDQSGRLVFETANDRAGGIGDLTSSLEDACEGEVVERLGGIGYVSAPLSEIAKRCGVAGLIIDYGHEKSATGDTLTGDTLQAVNGHKYEHPLCSPGMADLSAQVDFSQLALRLQASGFSVDGPVSQEQFLGRLGIVERASKLMAANPKKAGEIEAAVARLIAPSGMGGRFKVLGVRSQDVAPLPGF